MNPLRRKRPGKEVASESEARSPESPAEGGDSRAAARLREATEGALKRGVQTGKDLSGRLGRAAQEAAARAQRTLGEDYAAILDQNPLIQYALGRAPLLDEREDIHNWIHNIPLGVTVLWAAAAGGVVSREQPMARALGELLHYGPGHIDRWEEISRFMDSVRGRHHRLKFGHSIDQLPMIVEKYDWDAVPAFATHLIQDAMTVDGVPIIPNAWDISQWLRQRGVPAKAALGLVSVSFSRLLGAITIVALMRQLSDFGSSVRKRSTLKRHVKTAGTALEHDDISAAIENYKKALAVERDPLLLMALGEVYTRRAAHRLRAHRAFEESTRLLADRPAWTIPYYGAQLSARGLGALQALATADVLAELHPEYWHEHTGDLVNAAVFSFVSAAEALEKQEEDLVPDVIAAPANLSAAINRYLAARAACQYPLDPGREEKVKSNLRLAIRDLRRAAGYDAKALGERLELLARLWAYEVVAPGEADVVLAV